MGRLAGQPARWLSFPAGPSRWTWQPRLPELWLRQHEGYQFHEMMAEKKKEV
jgi:hypothetical protein